MPTNVRPDTKRHLFISPQTVTPGETNDSFVIPVPFMVQYMAVSNPTSATLQCVSGRVRAVPVDAISVQPYSGFSAEIEDTQQVTVFWTSDEPIPKPTNATPNRLMFWFSNEPIQLQIGSLSTGEASQVQVTNTITSIVEGSDGTDYHALRIDDSGNLYVNLNNNGVTVQSGHIVVDSISGVPLSAAQGITSTNQVNVGTSSTPILNGVVNGKRVRIANTDATNTLYVGASGVTVSNGYPIFPQKEMVQDVTPGQTITIYGVGSAALVAAVAVIN